MTETETVARLWVAFIDESKSAGGVAPAGSAFPEDSVIQSVAVETWLTSFAVVAVCVFETFEASPSDVITQA